MESEKTVENYLRAKVKAMGGLCYKFTSPGTAGVPDRIVMLPGGILFFAELKGTNGRLTKLQEKRIEEITKAGITAVVISSKAEVDRVLEEVRKWESTRTPRLS